MEGIDDSSRTAPEAARLAGLMLERERELTAAMVEAVFRMVPEYRALATRESVSERCRELVHDIFAPLARGEREAETVGARRIGELRARAGIPLAAVMDAFNTVKKVIWDSLSETAARIGADGSTSLRVASDLIDAYDHVVRTAMAVYRDQMRLQIRSEEQRRAALVQALLEGSLDGTSLWEAADLLRLPHDGLYVVIAARVPEAGQHALPQIELGLGELGIDSAWRLMHDLEVGVASLPVHGDRFDSLVAALTTGGGQVGVSPPYDDLRGTAQALRLARIALRGTVDSDSRQVAVFGIDPLACAAVSEPDVMERIARTVLSGLTGLPTTDRELLLSTFGAWFNGGGSAETAARELHVHPNTVRNRLRRLEEHTRRDLADPRQVAELSLAYEVDRRARLAVSTTT
ncbi:MAG TPA: helix-turn-helix domain-containing protein [Actinocrinis sp.]|uniref:PucR family transcriptional regulator n=1 Tax=Actinocrinis sp. TaxID=1920516 RepID=UPI002DDD9444|nr:helix-turn-helix domain-containing protein [Actinocrinis sp.]HEV2344096.1 helix-turn-helix domain-containing protein [Actinocrinis sp.]